MSVIFDKLMDDTQLKLLGFSTKEAEIYLTLNRIGSAPASTLARLTNIKRTSVYDILYSLQEKNLITSFQQGPHTYYTIDDVKKLVLREKEQMGIAENLVQQLSSESEKGSNIAVTYYRGKEGYREVYEDILRKKPKEIMVWINLDNFHSGLDMDYEEDWTKRRIRKKIYARLLMQDTPYARKFTLKDPKRHRETRLLKKFGPFEATCFIYEGNVTYFHAGQQITGININHPQIYQMQKAIFEQSWKENR
jgi:sugar-specific transcriptional regulator TrmB